ncbi:hypothetical protein niasHT_027171 [Heterodera trifolii]|uniref:SPRY domain-containing protein n=1 Tax=Heterodera trifolii TaxID=157864 RepID=A0ABD2KSX4_9BILA
MGGDRVAVHSEAIIPPPPKLNGRERGSAAMARGSPRRRREGVRADGRQNGGEGAAATEREGPRRRIGRGVRADGRQNGGEGPRQKREGVRAVGERPATVERGGPWKRGGPRKRAGPRRLTAEWWRGPRDSGKSGSVEERGSAPPGERAAASSGEGAICVGFAPPNLGRNNTVGWEEGSYAVESSGMIFSNGFETEHVFPFSACDKIAVSFSEMEKKISYFLNGEPLGQKHLVEDPHTSLVPTVTLRNPGDRLTVRFDEEIATKPRGI